MPGPVREDDGSATPRLRPVLPLQTVLMASIHPAFDPCHRKTRLVCMATEELRQIISKAFHSVDNNLLLIQAGFFPTFFFFVVR